eukprot:13788079-Ditylum_brightwellii.AAC.1
MAKCEHCATAKAKQKSLLSRIEVLETKLHDKETATAVNQRLYLDISTVKAPDHFKFTVTKPHWRMIVDEYTRM